MKYAEKATGFSHIVGYEYDLINNLTALIESINGIKYATAYAYDKDNRVTSIAGGISTTGDDGSLAINNATIKDYTYDDFGRVSQQVTNKYNGAYTPPQPPEPTETTEPTEATEPTEPAPDPNKAAVKTDTFQFTTPTGLSTESTPRTSSQISGHTIDAEGYDKTFSYIYDANGNILEISDGTNVIKYTYDKANQLIREDNQAANYTHIWTYDDAGNILSRTEYGYTTEALGTATSTAYVYGNSNWGDLLTSYNGLTIEHDNIGNPTVVKRGNEEIYTYTWKHGRQLATLTQGGTTWSFTYNADGIRTQRTDCPTCGSCPTRDDGLSCADDLTCAECTTCTNDATTYNYVYNGSSLSQLTIFARSDGTTVTTTLNFVYDASGAPMAVIYNGTTYYYVTNMQGDVIAILDGSGYAVVEYMYDAWGKLLSTTTDSTSNCTSEEAAALGVHNPLRYRGYVYDQETQLYYLQSRYYDPEIGRFLNADALTSTGQGILGNNMFAYCGSNPVTRIDPTGHKWMEPLWEHVRDQLISEKEKATTSRNKTTSTGLTASAAFGVGVSVSLGLTKDTKGNVGVALTINGGGGFPSLGAGGYKSESNAPTIYHQEGWGAVVGASGGPVAVAVGGEYNMMIDQDNNCTYHGATVSATYGFYPTLVEVHGEAGYTWVWGTNVYDAAIAFVEFISGS